MMTQDDDGWEFGLSKVRGFPTRLSSPRLRNITQRIATLVPITPVRLVVTFIGGWEGLLRLHLNAGTTRV